MRRGFTILEVLIGLSLLIVLVAGAYGMLLQLHTRQQEIATISARNTIGTTIIDSVERAMLTCLADGGTDGAGVTVTDSTMRVVYREVSPDLPVSEGAFGARARLAIIHHADSRTLELTTTRGSRSATTTIANIERVRFRAHDGQDWTAEFDSRSAQRLPNARYTPPEATYLAWIDCRELGLGDDPAKVFLDLGRVGFSSGVPFGEGGQGHVRFNLATAPAIVTEAVERMANAVAKHASDAS